MSTNNRFKNDTKHFTQQGSRQLTAVTQKEVEGAKRRCYNFRQKMAAKEMKTKQKLGANLKKKKEKGI